MKMGRSKASPLNNQHIAKTMIDYIEISNCLYKDSPNLSFCNPFSSGWNNYGYETYKVNGCRDMEVHWNPENRILKVKGSLPYFLNGHNFAFTTREYNESIEILQNWLGAGLWDASVDVFEYGAIFPVDKEAAQYIKNHTAPVKTKLLESINGRYRGHFKMWSDANVDLKMYDPARVVKLKQGMKQRTAIEDAGYNPEQDYLKFEMRVKKPYKLNFGRDILVEDLQNQDSLNKIQEILLSQYNRLQPMKELLKPTDKKKYNATDIVVGEFAKVLMNEGKPIAEAKKQIYQAIRDADCLSKQDKDSRRNTIKKSFDKLQEAESSEWDVTDKILESLDNENKPHNEDKEGD